MRLVHSPASHSLHNNALLLRGGWWQVGCGLFVLTFAIAAVSYRSTPETPLIILVGIGAVIFSLKQPFLVVLAFISLSLFRLHEVFPSLNSLHLPLIMAGLSLATLAWNYFGTRIITQLWTPALKYFAAFFSIVTAGLAFAVNRPLALENWSSVYLKIGVMTFAIAWLATRSDDFLSAARVFILSGVIVALVALQNWLTGTDLVEGTRAAIGSNRNEILGDPNDLALVLLFPLGFTLAGIARGVRRSHQFVCTVALPILLLAIVATQSRGALLGTLAVIAVFASRLVRSKIVLVVACIAAGTLLYFAMDISNRASGGSAEQAIDESANGRLAAWSASANMAIARPLSGVGLNNFSQSFYAYSNVDLRRDIAPHSTWFGVLGETGVPGLLVFVLFVFSSIRSALRCERALVMAGGPAEMRTFATAIVAALIGFCVSGSFLTQGFAWPVYVLAGLGAALSGWVADNLDCDGGTNDRCGRFRIAV